VNFSRRRFLAAGAGSAVVASTPHVPGFLFDAAAASTGANGQNILIVVQLSGGNDGLNTVVPYADDVPAVHFGSRAQPLALAGLSVHVPSIDSIDAFQLRGLDNVRRADAIQRAMDASRRDANDLGEYLQGAAKSALAASRQVHQAVAKYETPVDYPTTPLARKLHSVAQLVDAGMATRVYYVTIDGFDTHSEQSEAHAGLLRELGDAIAAFLKDVSHHGHERRVTVLAFSEFGRRVKENASRGTDHGAAAPVFVAGGAVAGGIVGQHPSLTDLDDGDLKYHTDFRCVYATLLEDWLGARPSDVLSDSFEKLHLFA